MKIIINIIISIFLTSFISCNNTEYKKKCLKEIVDKTKKSSVFDQITTELSDSLKFWSGKKIRLAQNYTSNDYSWEIGGVVFNSKNDKFLGWILKKNNIGELDFIKYFVGEQNMRERHFYLLSIPSLALDRNNEYDINRKDTAEFSFEELNEIALNELIKGGIIQHCSLNDNYIDDWFIDDGKELRKYHMKFLKDTIN